MEFGEKALRWSSERRDPRDRLLVDLGRCNRIKSDCGPPAAMKRGGRPTYLRRRSGENSGASVDRGRGSELGGGPGHGAWLLRSSGRAGRRRSGVTTAARSSAQQW